MDFEGILEHFADGKFLVSTTIVVRRMLAKPLTQKVDHISDNIRTSLWDYALCKVLQVRHRTVLRVRHRRFWVQRTTVLEMIGSKFGTEEFIGFLIEQFSKSDTHQF